jgi:phosphoribosylaminoimidazole-succinocarboxamide synthase
MNEILLRADLVGLPEPHRGKVRDVYDLGDELLIVTTDRTSAFDVILNEGIPDKGRVLNSLSLFWFHHFSDQVAHHALDSSWDALPDAVRAGGPIYRGRVLRARKARPLPVEWIVRGFIAGSLWDAYEHHKPLAWDLDLPRGLTRGQALAEPVFTPSTKATTGHDEPLSYDALENLIGRELARTARDHSVALFKEASARARQSGVILVDTKLEWGLIDDQLILIDECFTPDSSRFVLAETYRPSGTLHPYDKQLVRDFLLASNWDKKSAPPRLPPEIIQETRHRYLTIFKRLTRGIPDGVDVLDPSPVAP